MNNALLISLIGGGMVFVGLILLWGMMDILVRLTAEQEAPVEAGPALQEEARRPETEMKAAAAAAAVAVAMQKASVSGASPADGSRLSPWLSAGRSRQIESSSAFARRKKGAA
jgi:Na+-transporting methylmalonyl-CoA/oxaloacetate decarboxylase gamma subunit